MTPACCCPTSSSVPCSIRHPPGRHHCGGAPGRRRCRCPTRSTAGARRSRHRRRATEDVNRVQLDIRGPRAEGGGGASNAARLPAGAGRRHGVGELFPGPSKATLAYLHAEADIEDALSKPVGASPTATSSPCRTCTRGHGRGEHDLYSSSSHRGKASSVLATVASIARPPESSAPTQAAPQCGAGRARALPTSLPARQRRGREESRRRARRRRSSVRRAETEMNGTASCPFAICLGLSGHGPKADVAPAVSKPEPKPAMEVTCMVFYR